MKKELLIIGLLLLTGCTQSKTIVEDNKSLAGTGFYECKFACEQVCPSNPYCKSVEGCAYTCLANLGSGTLNYSKMLEVINCDEKGNCKMIK